MSRDRLGRQAEIGRRGGCIKGLYLQGHVRNIAKAQDLIRVERAPHNKGRTRGVFRRIARCDATGIDQHRAAREHQKSTHVTVCAQETGPWLQVGIDIARGLRAA